MMFVHFILVDVDCGCVCGCFVAGAGNHRMHNTIFGLHIILLIFYDSPYRVAGIHKNGRARHHLHHTTVYVFIYLESELPQVSHSSINGYPMLLFGHEMNGRTEKKKKRGSTNGVLDLSSKRHIAIPPTCNHYSHV